MPSPDGVLRSGAWSSTRNCGIGGLYIVKAQEDVAPVGRSTTVLNSDSNSARRHWQEVPAVMGSTYGEWHLKAIGSEAMVRRRRGRRGTRTRFAAEAKNGLPFCSRPTILLVILTWTVPRGNPESYVVETPMNPIGSWRRERRTARAGPRSTSAKTSAPRHLQPGRRLWPWTTFGRGSVGSHFLEHLEPWSVCTSQRTLAV